jgi:hypothetical protein
MAALVAMNPYLFAYISKMQLTGGQMALCDSAAGGGMITSAQRLVHMGIATCQATAPELTRHEAATPLLDSPQLARPDQLVEHRPTQSKRRCRVFLSIEHGRDIGHDSSLAHDPYASHLVSRSTPRPVDL